MGIATKTGDTGTTALMFGRRVSKAHRRVEAYGAVDELNAALGMARAQVREKEISAGILDVQRQLVILMGELAVAPEDRTRYAAGGFDFVENGMVENLTARIDELEKNSELSFKHWATPGYNVAAAALDVARTICRRAERATVTLGESGEPVNPDIVRFLNRLSDLCWLWARLVETLAEAASDKPKGKRQ